MYRSNVQPRYGTCDISIERFLWRLTLANVKGYINRVQDRPKSIRRRKPESELLFSADQNLTQAFEKYFLETRSPRHFLLRYMISAMVLGAVLSVLRAPAAHGATKSSRTIFESGELQENLQVTAGVHQGVHEDTSEISMVSPLREVVSPRPRPGSGYCERGQGWRWFALSLNRDTIRRNRYAKRKKKNR